MRTHRSVAITLFVSVMIAACSEANHTAPMTGLPSVSSAPALNRSTTEHLYALALHTPPHIFVFAQASKNLEAIIQPQGYGFRVEQIATDAEGTLYALGGSALLVYAKGQTTPTRTVPVGGTTMAVDPDGTVYASGAGPAVAVVPSGASTESRTITKGIKFTPISMALDKNGNLFVLQCSCIKNAKSGGLITEYARGSFALVNIIKLGFSGWGQIITDDQENLYVSDYWGNRIRKFPAGSTKPSLVITKGVYLPAGMVVDSAHNLYVASHGDSTGAHVGIVVYAPNKTVPTRIITSGRAKKPSLLPPVFDAKGNLYVAGSLGVSIFPPGASSPSLNLFQKDMRAVWSLAIGR